MNSKTSSSLLGLCKNGDSYVSWANTQHPGQISPSTWKAEVSLKDLYLWALCTWATIPQIDFSPKPPCVFRSWAVTLESRLPLWCPMELIEDIDSQLFGCQTWQLSMVFLALPLLWALWGGLSAWSRNHSVRRAGHPSLPGSVCAGSCPSHLGVLKCQSLGEKYVFLSIMDTSLSKVSVPCQASSTSGAKGMTWTSPKLSSLRKNHPKQLPEPIPNFSSPKLLHWPSETAQRAKQTRTCSSAELPKEHVIFDSPRQFGACVTHTTMGEGQFRIFCDMRWAKSLQNLLGF